MLRNLNASQILIYKSTTSSFPQLVLNFIHWANLYLWEFSFLSNQKSLKTSLSERTLQISVRLFCFQTPVSGSHKFQYRWVIFVKGLAACFIIYSLDVFPFKQRGRLSSSWGTWRVREVQRPWFKSLRCSQQAITFTCDRRLSASNTGHSLRRLVQITFYYLGPLEGPKLRLLLILMEFQLGH